MKRKEIFVLNEVELETLRRAAAKRSMPFEDNKTEYTKDELCTYGLVREGYSREELNDRGYKAQKINSFEQHAKNAEELLRVDTPFGSGIKKWELPIDMAPMKIYKTVFQPNTHVAPHIHPENTKDDPGGSLRIVFQGRIFYEGNEYGPGDWFFVPNGQAYEFLTDPELETIVFYNYRFFGVEKGNRFSHPHHVEVMKSEEEGAVK